MSDNRIVTFCCSKHIHVYPRKCRVNPAPPCKFHPSIDKAKEYLKERGIENPEIILND